MPCLGRRGTRSTININDYNYLRAGTGALKCDAAVINVTIYTSAFPAVTCQQHHVCSEDGSDDTEVYNHACNYDQPPCAYKTPQINTNHIQDAAHAFLNHTTKSV